MSKQRCKSAARVGLEGRCKSAWTYNLHCEKTKSPEASRSFTSSSEAGSAAISSYKTYIISKRQPYHHPLPIPSRRRHPISPTHPITNPPFSHHPHPIIHAYEIKSIVYTGMMAATSVSFLPSIELLL